MRISLSIIVLLLLSGCSTLTTPLIQDDYIDLATICMEKGGSLELDMGSTGQSMTCVIKEK